MRKIGECVKVIDSTGVAHFKSVNLPPALPITSYEFKIIDYALDNTLYVIKDLKTNLPYYFPVNAEYWLDTIIKANYNRLWNNINGQSET